MQRPAAMLALVLALVLVAAGCGEGEESAPAPVAPAREDRVSYDVTDVETALEGAGLNLQRDGDEYIGSEIEPEPAEAVHYASQAGQEFDLLIFATAQQARAARESLAELETVTEGGAYTTAENAVAVFPDAPERGVYATAWRVMRRLATDDRAREPDTGLSVAALSRRPDAFLGQEVGVIAPVLRVLPSGSERPVAIALDGAGDEQVLVIPADGRFPAEVGGEEPDRPPLRVEVAGRVGRIGEEGGPQLPPDALEVLARNRGELFVLATDVRVLGRAG